MEMEWSMWKVQIDGVVGIVRALTRFKAKWVAVRSWCDAGYGSRGQWPTVQAWKAPEFMPYGQVKPRNFYNPDCLEVR